MRQILELRICTQTKPAAYERDFLIVVAERERGGGCNDSKQRKGKGEGEGESLFFFLFLFFYCYLKAEYVQSELSGISEIKESRYLCDHVHVPSTVVR